MDHQHEGSPSLLLEEDVRRLPGRGRKDLQAIMPDDAISISSCESNPLAFTTTGPQKGGDDGSASEDEYHGLKDPVPPAPAGPKKFVKLVKPPPIDPLDIPVLEGGTSLATGAAVPPTSEVSAQPVGHVTSVLLRQRTVVVTQAPGAAIVDSGTVLVLRGISGGPFVVLGPIATLFGAVKSCAYAMVAPSVEVLESLSGASSEEQSKLAAADDDDDSLPSTVGQLAAAAANSHPLFIGAPVHYVTTGAVTIYQPDKLHLPGTDASFTQDEELPQNVRPDFSDDENEKTWKRDRKRQRAERAISNQQQAMNGGNNLLSALVGTTTSNTAGGGLPDEGEEVSSSDSEAEFDEEGQMLDYRPKKRPRLELPQRTLTQRQTQHQQQISAAYQPPQSQAVESTTPQLPSVAQRPQQQGVAIPSSAPTANDTSQDAIMGIPLQHTVPVTAPTLAKPKLPPFLRR